MIGQGRVEASPMAMAVVAASVGRGGTVTPRLLAPPPDEEPEDTPEGLTGDEAASLLEMMRGVVTDGSGSVLADVPGEPVGAKTGTAEFGTESPPLTHAWMIAVQGDLAVAVFVEEGDGGSATAGPILDAFLVGLNG